MILLPTKPLGMLVLVGEMWYFDSDGQRFNSLCIIITVLRDALHYAKFGALVLLTLDSYEEAGRRYCFCLATHSGFAHSAPGHTI